MAGQDIQKNLQEGMFNPLLMIGISTKKLKRKIIQHTKEEEEKAYINAIKQYYKISKNFSLKIKKNHFSLIQEIFNVKYKDRLKQNIKIWTQKKIKNHNKKFTLFIFKLAGVLTGFGSALFLTHGALFIVAVSLISFFSFALTAALIGKWIYSKIITKDIEKNIEKIISPTSKKEINNKVDKYFDKFKQIIQHKSTTKEIVRNKVKLMRKIKQKIKKADIKTNENPKKIKAKPRKRSVASKKFTTKTRLIKKIDSKIPKRKNPRISTIISSNAVNIKTDQKNKYIMRKS